MLGWVRKGGTQGGGIRRTWVQYDKSYLYFFIIFSDTILAFSHYSCEMKIYKIRQLSLLLTEIKNCNIEGTDDDQNWF